MSRFRNLTALAAALLVAAPALHAVELQSVAGTDTKLNVYGYVWAYANYYVNGNDNNYNGYAGSLFYHLSGGVFDGDFHAVPQGQYDFNNLPTRFGFASTTPSANLGDVKTKIEYDVNGSNDHLRHAYLSFGGWTIGKTWSLWNDLDASPDVVDWDGPIGLACFDTPRYNLIEYIGQIDKNNSVGISIEKQGGGQTDGSFVSGSSVGEQKYPSIVAMYTYSDSWGHIGLRVLGQNEEAYIPATPASGTTPSADGTHYNKWFAAFMLSGDVKFGKDDLVWSVYDGKALGNYGTGFQAALFDDSTQTITGLENLGWQVGFTHNWTDAVRSNISIGGVTFKSDDSTDLTKAGTDGSTGTLLKTGYYGELNTFVMLTKSLQFGGAVVYEQAKAFGSDNVWIDYDGSATNKISNTKIELSMKATF